MMLVSVRVQCTLDLEIAKKEIEWYCPSKSCWPPPNQRSSISFLHPRRILALCQPVASEGPLEACSAKKILAMMPFSPSDCYLVLASTAFPNQWIISTMLRTLIPVKSPSRPPVNCEELTYHFDLPVLLQYCWNWADVETHPSLLPIRQRTVYVTTM